MNIECFLEQEKKGIFLLRILHVLLQNWNLDGTCVGLTVAVF
jgi:hypothetical protein